MGADPRSRWVGEKICGAVENGRSSGGILDGQQSADRNGAGEGGEGLAIFGKAEPLGQRNPDGLFPPQRGDASVGQGTSEAKPVPTGLLENLLKLLWWQRKQKRVTLAGLFAGEDLRGGGAKEGDQFGEGCGQLVFQGDLANRLGSVGGIGRVLLPKNMEGHLAIRGIVGMGMGVPVGGVTVQFDITGDRLATRDRKGGAQKVGTSAVIPDAGMEQGNSLAGQRGERLADELFEPDPLEDGFGKNGGRLLPQKIFADPSAVGDDHGD